MDASDTTVLNKMKEHNVKNSYTWPYPSTHGS